MRSASVALMTGMAEQYLYLDVIPLLTAQEVGGFSRAATRRRGVAIAATLGSSSGFRMFRQSDCRKLVDHLRTANCVVGYNCINFDYELIRGRVPFDSPKTIDIMQVLAEEADGPVSMKYAVRHTLGRVRLPDCNALVPITGPEGWENMERSVRQELEILRKLHEHLINKPSLELTRNGETRWISIPQGKLIA